MQKSEREAWGTKIAELLFDRLQEEPQYTYCEINLFGVFAICNKQKELKHYGVMFACFCNRNIHIEIAFFYADYFLLTLRRFIGIRDNIRQMRSDARSNFVGTVKELWNSFQDINHRRINYYLQIHGADWITWIKNLPTASHMWEIWDRKIKTAIGILNMLLKTHGKV